MTVIHFYTTKDKYGFCSNFYRAKIVLDGKEWATTEHYYQAQKAIDPICAEAIRLAPTPKEAAKLGRTLGKIRSDWDEVKYGIMEKAVTAKFQQHPALLQKLKDTGTATLVEHTIGTSRPDPVWGDGEAGEGKNWLGRILMAVRDEA